MKINKKKYDILKAKADGYEKIKCFLDKGIKIGIYGIDTYDSMPSVVKNIKYMADLNFNLADLIYILSKTDNTIDRIKTNKSKNYPNPSFNFFDGKDNLVCELNGEKIDNGVTFKDSLKIEKHIKSKKENYLIDDSGNRIEMK